ncbi:MAG: RNA methyltransferase [Spirochaetota bacterium]
MKMMKNIRVVVMEPSGPGNVGSIARAMANFGADDLVLVNPAPYDSACAADYSCNGRFVLDKARIAFSLKEALSGTVFAVGTTRRAGPRETSFSAKEAAVTAAERSGAGRVALVFGCEKSGLKKEEKTLCHLLARIDTVDGAAGSLNISHAAAVFLYEICCAMPHGRRHEAADISLFSGACAGLLPFLPASAEPDMLLRLCESVISRSAPTKDEIRKLSNLLYSISAQFNKRSDDDN